MRKALRTGLIGMAALAAALLALPFLLPTGLYKERIEAAVSQTTGRKFTISGPVHFTLFPALGLRAQNITLSNPAGFHAAALASAGELRLGARLWPLLSGRLEVNEIVLDHPQIALEVDAKGHADWVLARPPAKPATSDKPRAAAAAITAHFSGLRIVQGSVTYFNARSATSRRIDGIDATVAATELDAPASATGNFAYGGTTIAFDAKVPEARALFDDQPSALDLSLKSDLLRATFKGDIAPDGSSSGHLTLDAPKLRDAGGWLGLKLPSGGGFQSLSLSTDFAGENRIVLLNNLTATLDGAKIAGRMTLDTIDTVPSIEGALSVDRLDLNPYIAAAPRAPGAPSKPHPHEEGWGHDPLALDVLGKADARLDLTLGSLNVKHLKLGRSHVAVEVRGGVLDATLDHMELYGGAGNAVLHVDARKEPAFLNILELDNVALQPFFSDTIGVTQIAGTGKIWLEVASHGGNADAIMHGLSGVGAIAFHDGQLRGVDLGQVARAIQAMLGSVEGKGAFTDYKTMGGSFQVANGVLTSKDFQLAGPLLQTSGEGRVDLGGRSIDFKIVPKATAEIAKIKLTVGVPFHIVGPWRHVSYKADLAAAAGSLLNGLLGHHEQDPNAPKKKHKSLGQALKNMLGIH